MIPLNYALAAVMLTSPGLDDMKEPIAGVRPALANLAVNWEIMDPRERRYVFTQDKDFTQDLKLIRRRYIDLKDVPTSIDFMRFPDRISINDMLTFNRAFREHLENRAALELYNSYELHQEIIEVNRRYAIWDAIRDCKCDYYYITVRRQGLKKVINMIGYENYLDNRIPQFVPVEFFHAIN